MGRQAKWTDHAKADLRAVDKQTALRILHGLAANEGDAKRIQEIEPSEYRLRIGDYRLRFHDCGETIEVPSVKRRREVYR